MKLRNLFRRKSNPQLAALITAVWGTNDLLRNQNQTLYAMQATQKDILLMLGKIHDAFYEEETA